MIEKAFASIGEKRGQSPQNGQKLLSTKIQLRCTTKTSQEEERAFEVSTDNKLIVNLSHPRLLMVCNIHTSSNNHNAHISGVIL